jgi:hypothetical protein
LPQVTVTRPKGHGTASRPPANAGTCQVPHDQADRAVDEIVGHLNAASVQPA